MHIKNKIFRGANQKESLLDLWVPEPFSGKLILFVHGYMGYKDWGCWNLVEAYFVNLGFGFCKYNVSHNGCSVNQATEFVDLESFAQNSYSKEVLDFEAVIDLISNTLVPLPEIYVIGHSRGGGIGILTANNPAVKKLATWAAISNISYRFPKDDALKKWQSEGVFLQKNGRTGQNMPHHFSQFTDFRHNQKRLDIPSAAKNIAIPWCIIHGRNDESVFHEEGANLARWSKRKLITIEGAQHTFGSSEPWEQKEMPAHLLSVCRQTAAFFLQNSRL